MVQLLPFSNCYCASVSITKNTQWFLNPSNKDTERAVVRSPKGLSSQVSLQNIIKGLLCAAVRTWWTDHFIKMWLVLLSHNNVQLYLRYIFTHFKVTIQVSYTYSLQATTFSLLCLIKFYSFIHFWLFWIFTAALRLSLAAVSRCCSPEFCVGCSLRWLLWEHAVSSGCSTGSSLWCLGLLCSVWNLLGPGMESIPSVLARWLPIHCTTKEVPIHTLIEMFIDVIEDSLQEQEKYYIHALHSVSPNSNIYKMVTHDNHS